MKLVPLNQIFEIKYGNQFDLNKMEIGGEDEISFVSRSSQNLGVVAKVCRFKNTPPYETGLITVSLGGTYLLSSFVQQKPFYTGQNVKVLRPLQDMTFAEKLFYCKAIETNRYRYTTHGREANSTLNNLLVPAISEVPNSLKRYAILEVSDCSLLKETIELTSRRWAWFQYANLFEIERGRGPRKWELNGTGVTPVVTSSDSNNAWTEFTDLEATHSGNTISVNRNGSVGEAFYQPIPFCSTEDVHVFNPKFPLNKYIAMFLIPLIKKEQYRYNYGRKWGISRMNSSTIKLPVDLHGEPDWVFMEKFIKSLPYSASI